MPGNSNTAVEAESSPSGYCLEVDNLEKSFYGVPVLKKIHFDLKCGEVHALMGENGAGKSTFINIVTGCLQPDGGEIMLDGTPVSLRNARSASQNGIAAIYQHGTAFPHLTVAENIFMMHEKTGLFGLLDWRDMTSRAGRLLRELGSNVDPLSTMGELSAGERQMVEIAKALSTDARILIVDEPTAALSWRECQELYRIVRQLRDQGRAIVFVSHRMEDIHALADRISVLRDGEYIGTWQAADIDDGTLIAAMAGHRLTRIFPERRQKQGGEILRLEHFSRKGYFSDIDLSVRRGEILGLTGLVGAGRSEVMRSLFGIDPVGGGRIFICGKEISISSPRAAMSAGIQYLPEDRLKQGLLANCRIAHNISLGNLRKFIRFGKICEKDELNETSRLASAVHVKARSIFELAQSLSGGNQQKTLFAKMLNSEFRILILDEPTKGVDVGAKSQIYQIIADLADGGIAVIMISSELPEILGLSDRVAVMREGKLAAIWENDGDLTQERILKAAMISEGEAK